MKEPPEQLVQNSGKTKLSSPPKVTKAIMDGNTLNVTVHSHSQEEEELYERGMVEATGVADKGLQSHLLAQGMRAFPFPDNGDCTREENTLLSILHEINPRNGTEALLATQMIHTHHLAISMLSRAKSSNQSIEDVERNVNMATKLTRMFTQQLDAFQKLQGKGQQKITVEHVNVNEGGQAIVGDVSYNGGG